MGSEKLTAEDLADAALWARGHEPRKYREMQTLMGRLLSAYEAAKRAVEHDVTTEELVSLSARLCAVQLYHAEHASYGGVASELHARLQTAAADAEALIGTLGAQLAAAERERDRNAEQLEAAMNETTKATSRAETAEGLPRGHEALLNTLRIGVGAARGAPDEDAVIATMLRTALQSLKGGSDAEG